ncbi:hypothetical protein DSCW_09210 [Desulfosarcina widdelii]|uniref:Poly A polymerase head domain-containing protein n=1 Tax=Desulfosarcina widdelii TaxID=947919 RepID=A0A5K7Z4X3_9BACT|nr:hypothetical protein [Desulfosarcina widdelii]BBO73504.1 hypothetical protein DSCW_09210 [Desulfosarcina widdelii]
MYLASLLTDPKFVQPVERFFHHADIRGALNLLQDRLPASARILVVGGALRNLFIEVLHGRAPVTRDIDIFVDGLDSGFPLGSLLQDQQFERTDLKGVRWYPRGLDLAYDIGVLADFLVIRHGHLEPIPENLLTGIDFSMNAILYDPQHQRLMERGCTAAIRDRMIDFNSRIIPDKRLMAYRILLMGHKTGFIFSEPVFQYVRNRLALETLTELKRLFTTKIGKTKAAIIMESYTRLCRFHSYENYRVAHHSDNKRG